MCRNDLMLNIWWITPTWPNKCSGRPAFMLMKIWGMFHVYKLAILWTGTSPYAITHVSGCIVAPCNGNDRDMTIHDVTCHVLFTSAIHWQLTSAYDHSKYHTKPLKLTSTFLFLIVALTWTCWQTFRLVHCILPFWDVMSPDDIGLGVPHTDVFFMRRVAFLHGASRRDLDNMVFCDIFCILQ